MAWEELMDNIPNITEQTLLLLVKVVQRSHCLCSYGV